MPSEPVRQKLPLQFLIIFLLLVTGIGTSGYMYYKKQTISLRNEKEKEIVSITDLKVEQIANWRKERLGDAETVYHSPLIISHFRQWIKGGSPEIKQEILTYMKSLQEQLDYKSIILLDIKGNILLAVPDGKEVLGPDAKRLAKEAIKTKKVVFSDLYRSKPANVIRITLIVPLLVSQGRDNLPVGVLLLRIDPYSFLYHLVQTWPTPSRTAETLLVRKDGGDVLFLNELRHKKDTALNFRIPLSGEKLIAPMLGSGQTGTVEGKDYRNIPVLAAIRAVPDSSWFLVSKIDQNEIYADLKKHATVITIIVSLLMLASGLGVLLIWRHQAAKYYLNQYETERERKLYAQRYEHLTKHANDIILLSEKEGEIVDANERAVETYGYDSEEILRLNLNDLRSPGTKDLLNEQLKDIEKRNGMVFETQHRRKDGTLFTVDVSSRIIDIDGKQYYQSIIRDITERKEAEERMYDNYFKESAINMILSLSLEDIPFEEFLVKTLKLILAIPRFSFESSGSISLVGDDPEVLEMKAWDNLSEPLKKLCTRVPFGKCLCGRAALTRKIVFADHIDDRHEICHEGMSPHGHYATPILFVGKTLGVINVYLNKGHTRNPEEETFLRTVADTLAGIIARKEAEEDKEKLHAQLLQAQKMEAVGQLAGGIAHDFNNILTAMIGYGHLLKMKMKEDDPLRTCADHILSLSDRAANLTQSLLAFSRKQIMNPRAVDINEIIRRVDHLLSRIIGEDIKLQTLLSEKDLIVMADPGQIEQVLMNLAANARDAMPKGGRLSIGTEKIAIDEEFIKEHGFGKEGQYALISLIDTGAGMDRETREKIFEPFFTTKEVGKGTGLGLSMVYGIIKQHDGYINVYSEPGTGTAFRIYLPLIEAKLDEIKPEVIQPIETGTETVLLAEDEEAIREFIKKLLEEYGYKVITAASGQEAIDEFKAHRDKIQLVLLDVIMPNKNGREAYEEMKKIMPDIKVLFMSGYSADIIQKHGIIEKGFAYIEKPASPTKLLRKIREVLGK